MAMNVAARLEAEAHPKSATGVRWALLGYSFPTPNPPCAHVWRATFRRSSGLAPESEPSWSATFTARTLDLH
jgi:hypothetical protein